MKRQTACALALTLLISANGAMGMGFFRSIKKSVSSYVIKHKREFIIGGSATFFTGITAFCFGRWNMKNKLTSKINKKNYELGKIKIENANNLSSIVTLEKDKEDIKKELNHMSSGILKILQEKNSSLKTVPLDWKMKVEAKDLDNSATSLNASFLDNNPVDEVKGNNNELSLTNGNNKDVFGTFTNDIIQKVAKKNTGSQV